jgi:hypothetical protein
MTPILILGLLTTPFAHAERACPDDASIRALKRQNAALEQALVAESTDPAALDSAFTQVQVQLGCVPDLPLSVVARSFLLLGAYYLDQGDEFRSGPFLRAAAVLEGESAWLDSLGDDVRVRFYNSLVINRPVGVVYAPELALDGEHHLVGSVGPPPWLMPVGTFTFQWNDRSVPLNVNERDLSLVVPRTFDEFDALVEGVTESDLVEPDYDSIVYYDSRADRRAKRQQRKEQEPAEEPAQDSPGEGPDDDPGEASTDPDSLPAEEPAVDANSFFDELAELETDDSPDGPPLTEAPPRPEKQQTSLSLRPHVGIGGAYTITGTSSDSPVGDAGYGGLGLLAELGLNLRLGEKLALRPELGFRSAGSAPDLQASQFTEEGYEGEIPVEALRDRAMLGQARLPVLLRLGTVAVGAGPAWAMGTARVTAPTACGEGTTCVAPMQGSIMAAGGSMMMGFRPGASSLMPWLDLTLLHDGERVTMAGGLVLAWEGSP